MLALLVLIEDVKVADLGSKRVLDVACSERALEVNERDASRADHFVGWRTLAEVVSVVVHHNRVGAVAASPRGLWTVIRIAWAL